MSRWRAPRRLKTTRAGGVFLALTLGVGVAALNTGNNLLYLMLGLQLATVVVSGLLSEQCLRGLTVERLHAEATFAGEAGRVTYRLQAGRSPGFALRVGEEGFSGGQPLPYLAAGESAVLCLPLPTQRRGPLRLSGITVTTLYPLGLFAKSRTFERAQTVWIFPRQRPPPSLLPSGAETTGDADRSKRSGGSGDLLGLRELTPQEDARRVHWPKSAALGKPLRVEREREEETTIELELPAAGSPEAFDGPCEAVAALAQHYLHKGFSVGLITPWSRLAAATGEAQRYQLLQTLARAGYPEGR
jgi:uncharacterized protein (DUF58 family)